MIPDYYDRLTVGDRRVSPARTITETDLVSFAMFTGDWHPMHTNVPWAEADERFGQRIAHGALTLSVALGLVTFWPEAMRAFYGIDKLRFVNPTFIGDTLHVETEILEIAEREDRSAVVSSRFVVHKHSGDPVLVATLRALVNGSPSEPSEEDR